jgi:hypothetical protein
MGNRNAEEGDREFAVAYLQVAAMESLDDPEERGGGLLAICAPSPRPMVDWAPLPLKRESAASLSIDPYRRKGNPTSEDPDRGFKNIGPASFHRRNKPS